MLAGRVPCFITSPQGAKKTSDMGGGGGLNFNILKVIMIGTRVLVSNNQVLS